MEGEIQNLIYIHMIEIPFFKTTNFITEKYLKSNYLDYYKLILDYVKEDNISISERIYLYQNNLTEKPRCLNCSEKVKFIKFYKGYRKYCSRRCSAFDTNKNEDIKMSRIINLTECNSDPIKRKEMTDKANKTKLLKSNEDIEISNKKRRDTNLKKWGVENISQNKIIIEDIKRKVVVSLSKLNREKSIKLVAESGFTFIDLIGDELSLKCNKCNEDFKIKRYLFNQRKRFKKTICLKCNPPGGKSDFENSVYNFIKENYSGEIITSYRDYKKYEIDIYLPELKIGFECNGLWWHSELYRDKKYHKEKLNFFKENNISIINIWEDSWYFKENIIKSRILYKLGKVLKIFARKCQIRYVNKLESDKFLIENHIQGSCISKVNIGLYYNNDLVFICTFGSLRKNLGYKSHENHYELLRSCSKLNFSVVGGFSKVLKFFYKEFLPSRLISYCDNSFNSGNSYTLNGFSKIKDTDPNYYWFHKDEGLRINRFNFRKDKLVKMGYDKSKTEVDIMSTLGYYRIWDCGSSLFEYFF